MPGPVELLGNHVGNTAILSAEHSPAWASGWGRPTSGLVAAAQFLLPAQFLPVARGEASARGERQARRRRAWGPHGLYFPPKGQSSPSPHLGPAHPGPGRRLGIRRPLRCRPTCPSPSLPRRLLAQVWHPRRVARAGW